MQSVALDIIYMISSQCIFQPEPLTRGDSACKTDPTAEIHVSKIKHSLFTPRSIQVCWHDFPVPRMAVTL